MDYIETIVGVTCFLIIVFTGLIVICVVCPGCPLANCDCLCWRRAPQRSRPEDIYVTDSIYYQPCISSTTRRPAVPGHGAMYQPINTLRPGHPMQIPPPGHGGPMYHQMGTHKPGLPPQPPIPGHGGTMYNPSTRPPVPGHGNTICRTMGPVRGGHHARPPVPDDGDPLYQDLESLQRPIDAPPAYESLKRAS